MPQKQKSAAYIFAKPVASQNAMEVQALLLSKPVKKFASDKDEWVFKKVDSYKICFTVSLQFEVAWIVFG